MARMGSKKRTLARDKRLRAKGGEVASPQPQQGRGKIRHDVHERDRREMDRDTPQRAAVGARRGFWPA